EPVGSDIFFNRLSPVSHPGDKVVLVSTEILYRPILLQKIVGRCFYKTAESTVSVVRVICLVLQHVPRQQCHPTFFQEFEKRWCPIVGGVDVSKYKELPVTTNCLIKFFKKQQFSRRIVFCLFIVDTV